MAKHIIGYSIITAMFIYFLFGDAENLQWARYDFATEAFCTMFLCIMLLRSVRDKGIIIAIKIFMGISIFKLLFNAYGFINPNVFDKVNNYHWTGGAIGGCILIFIIYKLYGLVKR